MRVFHLNFSKKFKKNKYFINWPCIQIPCSVTVIIKKLGFIHNLKRNFDNIAIITEVQLPPHSAIIYKQYSKDTKIFVGQYRMALSKTDITRFYVISCSYSESTKITQSLEILLSYLSLIMFASKTKWQIRD